jgi:hypothetical protein
MREKGYGDNDALRVTREIARENTLAARKLHANTINNGWLNAVRSVFSHGVPNPLQTRTAGNMASDRAFSPGPMSVL